MESPQDTTIAQKIAHYRPSPQALDGVRQVPILLVAGITAAGKDTVLGRLTEQHPDDYQFAISHTTRPRRENNGIMEQDGSPYYFIDKSTGLKMLEGGAFVEANFFASNLYGTSISELRRAGQGGKILINDVDVNGVDNFVRLGLNVKPVFLLPPSFDIWQGRLHARYKGAFNLVDLQARLQTALAELQTAIEHDYFHLVVNDDLDKAVEAINDIAHGQTEETRSTQILGLARELVDQISAELEKL